MKKGRRNLMSNCIELSTETQTVVFVPEEIDSGKLKLLLDSVQHIKSSGDPEYLELATNKKENHSKYFAWWFLLRNTEFRPDGGVKIRFGRGNSGHTWRDFGGTLYWLKDFIKKEKIHRFSIADEMDDFETYEPYIINFLTGKRQE